MKDFFNVVTIDQALAFRSALSEMQIETVPLVDAFERVLAETITATENLPDFRRSTMDGYAVRATATFGATESNPAFLTVKGTALMGETPDFSIGTGEACRISTGGMLPDGADSVVMIEHTEALDQTTIEVYRSTAPGQHVIEPGEDFSKDEIILSGGRRLRAQEIGLLAAFGREFAQVYRKPVVAIISTGDEVVPVTETPTPGKIRDINTHTLTSMVRACGGVPVSYGIVRDNQDNLHQTLSLALKTSDMVLVSGGSSVGVRDVTIEAISALPEPRILFHGISISPGKPTILAMSQNKAIWGLPGHVVSAMVVFLKVVKPFIDHISGIKDLTGQMIRVPACLSRNLSSAQGRVDFIRIKLKTVDGKLVADPMLGKSGLINTMVKADGLIEIGLNVEGLNQGEQVEVELMN
ncbi:MAG: molybdopterin molybdotransferase MoeA [Desulfatirhabdiaceae bacterium]|nr:molybdopterin molybdotransferase MoeA [Desulfatirhabdiaceae bacterium]